MKNVTFNGRHDKESCGAVTVDDDRYPLGVAVSVANVKAEALAALSDEYDFTVKNAGSNNDNAPDGEKD